MPRIKKPASSTTAAPHRSRLPVRLQNLIRQLHEYTQFSPQAIRRLMLSAEIQAEDLQAWEAYDHPASESYGRKLVYPGQFFEVLVKSWLPGDYSAIHDHGYTQWGAVQVFGPAEHASFLVQDGMIRTLNRQPLKVGQVLAVGHELVHQMGNPTDSPFLSLHVYGNYDRRGGITEEAQVFDLAAGEVLRTNGGVFYHLADENIVSRQPAPEPDYPSWLSDITEKLNRLLRMRAAGMEVDDMLLRLQNSLFAADHWHQIQDELEEATDDAGHCKEPAWWKLLMYELKKAAALQMKLLQLNAAEADPYGTYAELYDAVIGQPCLVKFMKDNWHWAANQLAGLKNKRILSIGCGTGLVESWLMDAYGLAEDRLLGIDVSDAMVEVAKKRIPARKGNVLKPAELGKDWDVVYTGLNVLQYIEQPKLRQALVNIAGALKPGGWFLGDFIAPDHIRWYPHCIHSADEKVISLRMPELIERNNFSYQCSEIINLSLKDKQLFISYEGKHMRYLVPLNRLRMHLEQVFGGKIMFVDALSLEPLSPEADTSPSTRYLVLAQKAE